MKKCMLFAICMGAVSACAAERVSNPGFEALTDKQAAAEWSWWTREKGKGRIEVSGERHSGERALRIIHDGEKDWNLANSLKTAIKPGESYKISCWMKRNGEAKAGKVDVVGYNGDKLVSWAIGETPPARGQGWKEYVAYFTVPESTDTVFIRITGGGKTDFWVDDVQVVPGKFELPPKGPKVSGWAKERPVEPMDRGVLAVQTKTGVYVSWRLLKSDPPEIAFDVYRAAGGQRAKLNAAPVRQTTDLLDTNAFNAAAVYTVEPAAGFGGPAQTVGAIPLGARKTPYISIPLAATNVTAQKVGVGDLDGDGVYDYVIKQPGANVDPWIKYWYKSQETFKLEAHRGDGTLLWIKDLGWNIERGMWYSPMVVCDLNGDGRAEVAAKIGPEEDLRDADGRAQKGPEWVGVFDGLTGREIARAPWLPREAFDDYNLASRNQLAVAYLDGKTPCLLVLRGTYSLMLAEAWQLKAGKLERLWSYSNAELPGLYRGQGAHNCLCADVDGDGRDEVILGSVTLDDDGSVLWCTGKGHPDAHYYGDIDPVRPGMELAYIIETRQRKEGGVHLLDPSNGKILWQLQEPTRHVHSCGMCTDMDVMSPGLEVYGADADEHKLTSNRWLFASNGALLKSGTNVDFSFGVPSAWWDADLQREILRGQARDYEGGVISERLEGSVVLVADVLGDWREEVITTVAGELRIYTTPIPAMDRRVCLMQDEAYRMRTTMNAMGYYQTPTLSYVPEALSPNLNLTIQPVDKKKNACRVVAVAPLSAAARGTVTLTAPKGVKLQKTSLAVDLKPGERVAETVAYEGKGERGDVIRAEWVIEGGAVLRGGVPLEL
jgi:rhamnogalacturonan endolyase